MEDELIPLATLRRKPADMRMDGELEGGSSGSSGDCSPTGTGSGRRSKKTVYRAAVVSSISPTEVEVLPDALLCVSPEGLIEWVENVDAETEAVVDEMSSNDVQGDIMRRHDLTPEEVDFVHLQEGFLCPGLIDTHTVSSTPLHRPGCGHGGN